MDWKISAEGSILYKSAPVKIAYSDIQKGRLIGFEICPTGHHQVAWGKMIAFIMKEVAHIKPDWRKGELGKTPTLDRK